MVSPIGPTRQVGDGCDGTKRYAWGLGGIGWMGMSGCLRRILVGLMDELMDDFEYWGLGMGGLKVIRLEMR